MPNRIIKESICTSDTVDRLSWFEEVLFYRLIVNCDDYGRFDGRVPIIKNRLFPLKSNLTEKTVGDALNKLSTAGLVKLYLHDSKPILQLATWEKHQQVRSKKSKYPAFDEVSTSMKSSDINCNQMISNVPVIQSNPNPIQSESNPKHADAVDGFERFWSAYPKKKAKADAEKAWKSVIGEQHIESIISAIVQQKESDDWQKADGQYIPYPATWLRGRRWEDSADKAIIHTEPVTDEYWKSDDIETRLGIKL